MRPGYGPAAAPLPQGALFGTAQQRAWARGAALAATVLLAQLGLASHAVAAGPLMEAAAAHPPLHGVVPKGSDVVFSTRSKRPEALPVIQAYGATRVEWVYGADRAYVAQLKQNAPWFGATLNANPRLPSDAGYVRDFDGQVLAAPWMQGWNVFWASSEHPDAQRVWADQLRAALEAGADAIQFDDPLLQAFAALNQGGDFNVAMQSGFSAWLRKQADPAAVRAAGLQDLGDGPDAYKAWLTSQHGVRDTADYRRRLRQLPSTPLWLAYTRHTVLQAHRRLRDQAAALKGRAVPLSMNLGTLVEPVESNPFFFLTPLVDYSMAETQIKDFPLQVQQAATARALGMGFVPSLKPLSLGENRTAIAYFYALGAPVVVPWDVYDGNDAQGKPKPRFFGAPADYADLYAFVRANASLFDGLETTPVVGIVVPVDKGETETLRALVRKLVGQQIPFAFVPVGGEQRLQADARRLASLRLLVTTNPDADYPAAARQALAQSGVARVAVTALKDDVFPPLRPFQVAPGADRLRLVPKASAAAPDRLVVHLVDAARGEQRGADAGCQRRIGIRRDMLGSGRVAGATFIGLDGSQAVEPDTAASATHVFFSLRGCTAWGALDLRLKR